MAKKNSNQVAIVEMPTKRTAEELIKALENFANASVSVVGIDRTVDVLNFLTEKISESPESFQKITNPETVAKFKEVLDKSNGRMPGPMELMGLIGTFKEIFA
jgi:hypothetical protein